MEWYVIHTYAGYEEKVKEAIENKKSSLNMEKDISRVVIPTEQVMEIKKGKKVISTRKIFPGYLLLEMEMNSRLWYIIKSTPGIIGFVGSGRVPVPLTLEEIENILGTKKKVSPAPILRTQFEVHEMVNIISGPFSNFKGEIVEINIPRGKLKVLVTIFGRATPLELDFSQVQKL